MCQTPQARRTQIYSSIISVLTPNVCTSMSVCFCTCSGKKNGNHGKEKKVDVNKMLIKLARTVSHFVPVGRQEPQAPFSLQCLNAN